MKITSISRTQPKAGWLFLDTRPQMTDEIYRGLSTNRIGDFEIKFSDGLFAVRPIELTKEAVKQINQKLTQAEEPIAKKQKAYEQQRDTVLAEISKSSGLPIK